MKDQKKGFISNFKHTLDLAKITRIVHNQNDFFADFINLKFTT